MSDDRSELIVLIPAYKEELTISMVVTLSLQHASKVIVVDDGSPDRTSELAKLAGAEVIRQEINQGKAAALMVGFQRCRELSPKCVVMIDGDGQMDPALIPNVAAPILAGEADLVIGSRFIGEKDADIPRHRVVGQKILNQVTNVGSKDKITDTQSGYRALSPTALNNMEIDSERYNIESDMIMHLSQIGLRIVEVPITVRYDVPAGHKQKPFRHGYAVLSRIFTIIGYRRPLIVFGIPGAALFILGGTIALATFAEVKVLFGWTLVTQATAAITIFFLGLFLLFDAMILNSLTVLMSNIQNTIGKKNQ
ncbi:MAG: glycosyltransferase family 2 protein [Methanomassiliicoccales archaeon]|nr:glycosyltransferase family 2 protein [Methanomassiliicoccales archaeon]